MTDRELLERAAKAAGYVVESIRSEGRAWCYPIGDQPDEDGDHPGLFAWDPLNDDGDALRLAVKLRISLNMLTSIVDATTDTVMCHEPWDDDDNAATRRAIVRAAAAIGEQS